VTHKCRRGLTLIEVVVSTLLVSTILLASLNAAASFQRNQSAMRASIQSRELADRIFNEITCRYFRDPVEPGFGVEADEFPDTRSSFDDIDDYDQYSEQGPTRRDGTNIDGFAGWSYVIRVVPVEADTSGVTTSNATVLSPLRRITVSCTSPDGETIDSVALVSDRNLNNSDSTSFETWRRLQLRFSDREIELTSPLRNQPESTP